MSVPDRAEGSILRMAETAPHVGIEELAGSGPLLVVVPHPDDETLGCGMAIAAAARNDRPIVLALVTDGEGSHPGSARYSPAVLARLRACELEAALRILVPGASVPIVRLNLPDGCSRPEPAAQALLLAFARDHDVQCVWSTWVRDPHCDHQTAAVLAAKVATQLRIAHWSFPVWGRFGERPAPVGLRLFEAANLAPLKRKAMAAHASQTTRLIEDDPQGFVLPPALFEHFADHAEIFIHG